MVQFLPDNTLFRDYKFRLDFVETMVNNYTYLNAGLQIFFNGKRYLSRHGLLDLLKENMTSEPLYLSSYICRATTLKWCLHTPTNMARNTIPSSTDSTPPPGRHPPFRFQGACEPHN